jgi:hypothetical protein
MRPKCATTSLFACNLISHGEPPFPVQTTPIGLIDPRQLSQMVASMFQEIREKQNYSKRRQAASN